MGTAVENSANAGICFIKEEFLLKDHERSLCTQHVAKEDIAKLEQSESRDADSSPAKKIKLEQKKKLKGQNKDRRKGDNSAWKTKPEFCPNLTDNLGENGSGSGNVQLCSKGENCKFQHDPAAYLASKPPDIGPQCFIYRNTGHCPWGISCRFGGDHLNAEGVNIIADPDKKKTETNGQILNILDKETVTKLWKKRYDFDLSSRVLKETEQLLKRHKADEKSEGSSAAQSKSTLNTSGTISTESNNGVNDKSIEEKSKQEKEVVPCELELSRSDKDGSGEPSTPLGAVVDSDLIKLRLSEKKRLDWKGLLYLSPLTTVGNLPFRRICVEYGADITCSEMTLSLSLLQGTREWSLVKRHHSEKIFGVQICGNNPMIMTKTAQLLEEKASIDFVDINMGCPIDALYQQGCGSGMMARKGILLRSCHAMSSVLKEVPLTVKLRTGLTSSNPLAHNLMSLFRSSGVSLATVHGRSREQRYTKNADWCYINDCAKAAAPMPVFGNGDILSYEDYNRFLETAPDCSGTMVGRGALIKPWIFQEIKEKRHIDIPSNERFDIIKKYVNYGLEHWGSDTRGVETTRRFLLEWLSFLYRYVPVGLLERVPQAINQRPPLYRGRDEMETLMASGNCSDWIKISEMLLGPVPEGFVFLPKHKSNAWK